MKRTMSSPPLNRQGDDQFSELPKKFKPDDVEDALPSFSLLPKHRFARRFPYFGKPKEIGCFSLDDNRVFHPDRSQLRYFSDPRCNATVRGSEDRLNQHNRDPNVPLNLDLHAGYEQLIARDETLKEKLNDILRWILFTRKNRKANCASDTNSESPIGQDMDFVCWRGLLTKLVCCPFENKDGWKIVVARFNGSLYLCDVETDEKIEEKKCEDERSKVMTYGGFKFEQYVTANKPDGVPDTSKPVNTNQAFVSVVSTRLGNHSLVFGGEVDCCSVSNPSKYIELKTSRKIDFPNQQRNFKRFKMIKWWAQSFLIGIEEVVCGFRDDDGKVLGLETFSTFRIPSYCADNAQSWNGDVCFNFFNDFLDHVKQVALMEHNQGLYLFDWSPGKPINCKVVAPDSEYAFLPDWYLDEFREKDY